MASSPYWAVDVDGFSEVGLEAPSAAAARWKAAKACYDAGYGDRREGPFSLIRRGVQVRAISDFDAMAMCDTRHWVD